jgi:hypothetical protein
MRTNKEILHETSMANNCIVEVLLDIRDLLNKMVQPQDLSSMIANMVPNIEKAMQAPDDPNEEPADWEKEE